MTHADASPVPCMLVVLERVAREPRERKDVANVVVGRVEEVDEREGRRVPDADGAVACEHSMSISMMCERGGERRERPRRTGRADEPPSSRDELEGEDGAVVARQAGAGRERREIPDLQSKKGSSATVAEGRALPAEPGQAPSRAHRERRGLQTRVNAAALTATVHSPCPGPSHILLVAVAARVAVSSAVGAIARVVDGDAEDRLAVARAQGRDEGDVVECGGRLVGWRCARRGRSVD